MNTIVTTKEAFKVLAGAPCTLDAIRFYEVAETRYTVDASGKPQQEIDTAPTDESLPRTYSCEYHGFDFSDWEEVKKHLEQVKKGAPSATWR